MRAGGRNRSLGLLGLLALTLGLVPSAAVAQDPTVARVEGADRFATAAAAAEAYGPGVARVLVATGRDFPDALAAGPLAGREGWPILLVEQGSIPPATAAALDRLAPEAITVLGGTRAVSAGVERRLADFTAGTVDRLRGADRYATAAAIADTYYDGGVEVAYVATGADYADALAGGPAAAAVDAPLLLVGPSSVPTATRTSLERLRPDRIVVLGGARAVGDGVVAALEGLTDGEVTRRAGEDRYATAAEVATAAFPDGAPTAYLATGQDFPDALTGAALAGTAGAPLLTVAQRCAPDDVVEALDDLGADRVVVLGGTRVVSDAAAALSPCGQTTPDDVTVSTTTVAGGLDAPWDVAFVGDRAFLTERDSGVVSELVDGATRTVRTFEVDPGGEGGLLGLTTSPDGRLYALYVDAAAQDQRIVSFAPDGGELRTVVSGLPRSEATNHFGGRIAFGPDGLLYVGLGDMSNPDRAQDLTDPAGAILRYEADGTPAGAAWPSAAHPALYAAGFRDPQGLAWDGDGRMFASEFGQDRQDEVDRVIPGRNYGWPVFEGDLTYEGGPTPDRYEPPLFTAPTDQASWSGATVLVDGAIPQWEDDLFVAALRGQRLYRLDLDDGALVGTEALLGDAGRLRTAVQAPDGSLWVLTSNCDGRGSCPTGADDRILRLGP